MTYPFKISGVLDFIIFYAVASPLSTMYIISISVISKHIENFLENKDLFLSVLFFLSVGIMLSAIPDTIGAIIYPISVSIFSGIAVARLLGSKKGKLRNIVILLAPIIIGILTFFVIIETYKSSALDKISVFFDILNLILIIFISHQLYTEVKNKELRFSRRTYTILTIIILILVLFFKPRDMIINNITHPGNITYDDVIKGDLYSLCKSYNYSIIYERILCNCLGIPYPIKPDSTLECNFSIPRLLTLKPCRFRMDYKVAKEACYGTPMECKVVLRYNLCEYYKKYYL